MLLYINYFSDNNKSTMDTPTLPPILLQRIKLLVSKNPVLSEQSFTAHFFEMFHEDLDPLAAGYPSISSLLDTLASLKVVNLTYGNFGIIIKPSLGTLKETRMMPREGSDLTELDNITTIQHEECVFPPKDCVLSHNLPVEELPHWMKEGETRMMPREGYDLTELVNITTIQHEECVFPPKDCVLSQNLPVEELPQLMKEGETFPVVITQVESPTSINYDKMDKMVAEEMRYINGKQLWEQSKSNVAILWKERVQKRGEGDSA